MHQIQSGKMLTAKEHRQQASCLLRSRHKQEYIPLFHQVNL